MCTVQRTPESYQACKDIIACMKDRAHVERQYARQLTEWSNKWKAITETRECQKHIVSYIKLQGIVLNDGVLSLSSSLKKKNTQLPFFKCFSSVGNGFPYNIQWKLHNILANFCYLILEFMWVLSLYLCQIICTIIIGKKGQKHLSIYLNLVSPEILGYFASITSFRLVEKNIQHTQILILLTALLITVLLGLQLYIFFIILLRSLHNSIDFVNHFFPESIK